jgi:hypothetical protein
VDLYAWSSAPGNAQLVGHQPSPLRAQLSFPPRDHDHLGCSILLRVVNSVERADVGVDLCSLARTAGSLPKTPRQSIRPHHRVLQATLRAALLEGGLLPCDVLTQGSLVTLAGKIIIVAATAARVVVHRHFMLMVHGVPAVCKTAVYLGGVASLLWVDQVIRPRRVPGCANPLRHWLLLPKYRAPAIS